MEAATQRCSKCGQAQARAVLAVTHAGVGTASARGCPRASRIRGADARGRHARCSVLRGSCAACPRHGFGFVGQKRGASQPVMAAERAAAYLSSYFVSGRGAKTTLMENARNPHLPRVLIWVSPQVTRQTGVTMRSRRRCRQLWAVRTGLLPPPSWSGVELARAILLAGPWPSTPRGP
jgi:hypothetical protein